MATPGGSPARSSPLKYYSSLPTGDDEDSDLEPNEPAAAASGGGCGTTSRPLSQGSSSTGTGPGSGSGGAFSTPPASPTRTIHSAGGRAKRGGSAACASALWEEDTPFFKARVQASIAEGRECSAGVKELAKGMKELEKATSTLAAASRLLARANSKAAARLPPAAEEGGLGGAQPLLARFGATCLEMAVAQETLAHALRESVVAPLEAFAAEGVDRAVELERAYEREKGEFTDALGKLLRTQIKPTLGLTGSVSSTGGGSSVGVGMAAAASSFSSSPSSASALAAAPRAMGGGGPGAGGVLVQRARELGRGRRAFEQARLRLAGKVEELETRRTLEVTEGVAAALLHLESHHRLCLDVLGGLAPSVERLREAQDAARARLEAARGQWERKAEMLEMLLPADLAGKVPCLNLNGSGAYLCTDARVVNQPLIYSVQHT